MVEGNPPTMFGRPVYNSPDLPTAAANNISVLFGDFQRAYTVRRVQGFGVQRLNELYSANGQIGFRGFERVDGRVVLASVAIGLKHSAT
jgi:HK97 family phage major capsid protein